MSTIPDSNPGGDDDPSNVLLLTPSVGDCEATACGELVRAADPAQSHVVLATGLRSADRRLAELDAHVGSQPAETTVVDLSLSARSAAAGTGSDAADRRTDVTVERVDGTDLLTLGTTLDTAVERTDLPTVLCVDSVSDLLQSSDRESVFRFLDVLTRCVDRTETVGHYHLRPDVHSDETVETLAVLFDAVVDLREAADRDH